MADEIKAGQQWFRSSGPATTDHDVDWQMKKGSTLRNPPRH